MKNVKINSVEDSDYDDLAVMVGELLQEIVDKTNLQAFNFDAEETRRRAKDLVARNKYWIFIAKEVQSKKNIGFITLYESYALYAEGAYGTIPELYIRPAHRSKDIGKALINRAVDFGESKNWSRLEVTTPQLPQFEKALHFYQTNGFEITGGRKLKKLINK